MTEKSQNRIAKEKEVKEFATLIKEYPVVGVVNMQNLPTMQLQNMREQLRGTVVLKMTKGRLLKLALKASGKEHATELEKYLSGMPAMLFSKESPFKLYKKLKKNKSKAPIKGGQVAPNDIIIPAGPTPFAPGPVIGELGKFRVKTGVENGKVAVKEDAVVAKEGDTVDAELAGLLTRLKIEPMEIGLDLKAVLEEGDILTKDVLDVDEDKYLQDIKVAASEAINLAMFAAYPTTETTDRLIGKAFSEAKALALEANIMTDLTAGDTISKAERQMLALKDKLNLPDVEEAPKEEVKAEEPKAEEKPAEKVEEKTEEPKVEEKKEEAPQKEKAKEEPKVEEKKSEPEEAPKAEEKTADSTVLEKSVEKGDLNNPANVSEEDRKAAEDFVKNMQEGKLNK